MARSVAGAAPGRTNRRFLIIAVLFAALSGALVYAWMASQDGTSDDSGASSGAARQVVVAKTVIRQRTEITADMLEVKSLPANAIVEGGFTTIEDVVGKVAKLPLEVNEQITTAAVVDTDRPTAEALALVVPNGRRGFSINATQVKTAGGLILPGDYVDIMWVCCEKGLQVRGENQTESAETDAIILSRTIVQNVQVAAVAQQIVSSGPVASGDGTGIDDDPVASDSGDEDPEAVTITLLVTPEQAHILLMAENTGDLRAALRGIGDANIVPPAEDHSFTTPGLIPPDLMQQLVDTLGPQAGAQ
jgi:pilus assembly protein CpaB